MKSYPWTTRDKDGLSVEKRRGTGQFERRVVLSPGEKHIVLCSCAGTEIAIRQCMQATTSSADRHRAFVQCHIDGLDQIDRAIKAELFSVSSPNSD